MKTKLRKKKNNERGNRKWKEKKDIRKRKKKYLKKMASSLHKYNQTYSFFTPIRLHISISSSHNPSLIHIQIY